MKYCVEIEKMKHDLVSLMRDFLKILWQFWRSFFLEILLLIFNTVFDIEDNSLILFIHQNII